MVMVVQVVSIPIEHSVRVNIFSITESNNKKDLPCIVVNIQSLPN